MNNIKLEDEERNITGKKGDADTNTSEIFYLY